MQRTSMQGVERVYCDVCIHALVAAWRELLDSPASETLRHTKYGKGDTLGLDAITEIIIHDRLCDFDRHAILVTEELDDDARERWPTDAEPIRQPLMFFSDPTDRSRQLREYIETISRETPIRRLGLLMGRDKGIQVWERMFEKPAMITGATSSITCVRKGQIIFSVILNIVTQTIFVATPLGNVVMRLPRFGDPVCDQVDLNYVLGHGRPLIFPPAKITCQRPDDFKRFVTFLGKEDYEKNFIDSMVFVENPDDFLHHTLPGGPARILYLSELQRGHGPIGFIMANGEKIGEWIHWLAFAKFAMREHGGHQLRIFEIAIPRPHYKDGVLMSTAPAYSIFSQLGSTVYLDVSRLRTFETPSRFRSMLVVAPFDNERIAHIMRQHCYREIDLS
ncbi:MAG: hypothetical protein PHI73_01945 [Patescibacteria group bacterium]|nr:hypothetical protein [Patescibacteria group bacterium]